MKNAVFRDVALWHIPEDGILQFQAAFNIKPSNFFEE
jgi:hypothetical protein